MRKAILVASIFLGMMGVSVCSAQQACKYTQPNQVPGSWIGSCKLSYIRGCTLFADCIRKDGSPLKTQIDLTQIGTNAVNNCDGKLTAGNCPPDWQPGDW